jgi:predicted TIM-barrel fold metal-dependent hydrolase
MNAQERVQLLDAEGLDAALLYPTLGVLWEAELDDVELTLAYCRAYNRWLVDFCRNSGGRLVPIAHIPFDNPEAAAIELERAVKDGCKGAFTMPFTWSRKAHGDPVHDPIFRKAVELDVPIAIHVGFEPFHARPNRFENAHRMPLLANVTTAEGLRHAFTTFFDCGTFERFPDLRLVLLESGGGWIGQWLDRLDVMFHKTVIGERAGVTRAPSEWFKSNCWISCDPDEKLIPAMMEIFGEDRFIWASDFPHADHTPDYIVEIERMADSLPASARPKLLGDNVRTVYKL